MLLAERENLSRFHFSSFISPASFWFPEWKSMSAWIEHAPFAFWLIETIKPWILVELGTHTGYSYFAFCQAIKKLNLITNCYAIDTWKGDEHAGFYEEEIFATVNEHNNQYYSGFSSLIRSTFDEAIQYFNDGSIDLLHLDGRHFYEDVKYDFESWFAKLSDRAIVLFHDINVRELNFGVCKYWEELKHRYPYFEFMHGHGLGVLGVGRAYPTDLQEFFSAMQDTQVVAKIRFAYSQLGAALSQIHNLSQSLTSKQAELSKLQNEFLSQQHELIQVQQELSMARQSFHWKPILLLHKIRMFFRKV